MASHSNEWRALLLEATALINDLSGTGKVFRPPEYFAFQFTPRSPVIVSEAPPRVDMDAWRKWREGSSVWEVAALLDEDGHYTTIHGQTLTSPHRIAAAIVQAGFTWCEPRHVKKARGLIKKAQRVE